jgi:cell division protein FtsB
VRRLTLALVGALALAALAFLTSVVGQGFEELARVRAERRRLSEEKTRLERRVAELHATLEAVRSSPEATESLARRDLGWVRPGETVIVFATPTPPPPIALTEPAPTPILALRE